MLTNLPRRTGSASEVSSTVYPPSRRSRDWQKSGGIEKRSHIIYNNQEETYSGLENQLWY